MFFGYRCGECFQRQCTCRRSFKCELCGSQILESDEHTHQDECPVLARIFDSPDMSLVCEICNVPLQASELDDHRMAHSIQERASRSFRPPAHLESFNNPLRVFYDRPMSAINLEAEGQNRARQAFPGNIRNNQPFPGFDESRNEQGARQRARAGRTLLRQLEPSKYNGDTTVNCTVCLEDVKKGQQVITLPCVHQFHANCIRGWLRANNRCPICRSSF